MAVWGVISLLCYLASILIGFSLFRHTREHRFTLIFFILAYSVLTAVTVYEIAHNHFDDQIISVFTCISALFFLGASIVGSRIVLSLEKSINNLKDAEQRYRTLFEMLPIGVVVHRDGNFLYVNKSGLKLTGVESFDLLKGKKLFDFIAPEHHNVVAERVRKILNHIGDPLALPPIEERLLKLDGTPFTGEVVSAAVMDGNLPTIITAFRDISEKKAVEDEKNRLAATVTHTAEAIAITDTSANIQYVNPAFERLTGYSRSELEGKNMRIFRSGVHEKEYFGEMWKTALAGKVWSGTMINRRKGGGLYEERATIAPVFGPKGEITNFVCVKSDIAGETLLRRSKDFFIMITSHEMRTPLTKLQFMNMIINDLEDAGLAIDRVTQLKELSENVFSDFNRIISATSMLSVLSASREKGGSSPIYPYMALLKSFNNTKEAAAKSGRKVTFDIDLSALPMDTEIEGNLQFLERCFDELFSNAVKYTPEGKMVRAAASLQGASVTIEITDEGIGIEPKEIDNVIEPFFSLERPELHSTGLYKFRGGGIGLGLTLVKYITEFHNGALKLYSQGENHGVRATLTFPIGIKSADDAV